MNKYSFKFITIGLSIVLCVFLVRCSSSKIDDSLPNDGIKETNKTEETNDLIFEGEATTDRLTANEDRFYVNKIPNLEVEAQLNGNCSTADSQLLNQEIASISSAGGGVIRIRKRNLLSKYDHRIDPNEWKNRASETKNKEVMKSFREELKKKLQ